ncbi:serine/threonine protein kinase [Gemmatimonas sp.]|uniref:serine/threonine protein kinase n=1 Tax=Gemmatimonas sp. TaxID=1962908 RepID=UPI0037BEF301
MAIETLVGTTLAGYTVRGKVGEGGTSTVFRADHATHGTVALKVLREKLQHDKTAVARFLREAQFGARVEHPNIVRTLDYGQSESERYYLAIEWAGGEILDKYAEKSGPLPAKDVAEILSQICSAVQAAHDVGIVHRDLKPENVMYDPATHHVKLLDFGIAADTDAAPDQRLTRAGFFVGTLMYVAPEALSGELVGPAADQYSLATIAYFLLTGVLPYTGKSPRELFSQLLTQPPVALSKAKPNLAVPVAVELVVMKALSKQPSERYPTVKDFSDAFASAAQTTAMASTSQAAAASTSAAATEVEGEDKGGLFGKMKGLFRRS